MKVVIDPAIEKRPEYLDGVQKANDYLRSLLGDLQDTVEVNWSLPPDQPGSTLLELRSLDDAPGKAEAIIPFELLQSYDRRIYRVGDVMSRLLKQRTKHRLRELREMAADLKD